MAMTSSTLISNSPAISTTRNLLKPNLRKSLRTPGVEPDGPHAPRQPCVSNTHCCSLLAPEEGAQLVRRHHLDDIDSLRPQQGQYLLATVARCIVRHHRQLHRASRHLGADLFHTDDHQPTAKSQTEQRGQLASLGRLGQAAPPSAGIPPSSVASSVVSSSRIPMIRSASAGAMPGSFRKSLRSRSMISFRVR